MIKKEEILHLKVCDYLRKNYPDVLFRTDFSSGMKMSPGQAAKHKKFQKRRAWPDFFIAEPRKFANKIHHGMYIEFKSKTIYKLDGTLRKNEHVEEQAETLTDLREKGYYAEFAIGYEDAITQITNYLGKPKPKKVEF